MFLSNWLNGVGQAGHLPVSSRHLSGEAVNLRQNSLLRDALRRGGAVVVLVDFDGGHYVLLTGIQDDQVYLFDPYYREIPFEGEDIQMVTDHPMAYNRVAPVRYFEREERGVYSMGPVEEREAVLLFNQRTKLTEEKTVEYII
jgi:predicted double-glycine peptidase